MHFASLLRFRHELFKFTNAASVFILRWRFQILMMIQRQYDRVDNIDTHHALVKEWEKMFWFEMMRNAFYKHISKLYRKCIKRISNGIVRFDVWGFLKHFTASFGCAVRARAYSDDFHWCVLRAWTRSLHVFSHKILFKIPPLQDGITRYLSFMVWSLVTFLYRFNDDLRPELRIWSASK